MKVDDLEAAIKKTQAQLQKVTQQIDDLAATISKPNCCCSELIAKNKTHFSSTRYGKS